MSNEYKATLAEFEEALRAHVMPASAKERPAITRRYYEARRKLVGKLQYRQLAAEQRIRRCTSTMSEDGGSGSPRVPCTGAMQADGTLIDVGCGEPCSFIMDRASQTYPTEDAYLAACRAGHWRTAELRAHGIEPIRIPTDAPQYPPDNFDFIAKAVEQHPCKMANCSDVAVCLGLCQHHWDWLNGR